MGNPITESMKGRFSYPSTHREKNLIAMQLSTASTLPNLSSRQNAILLFAEQRRKRRRIVNLLVRGLSALMCWSIRFICYAVWKDKLE